MTTESGITESRSRPVFGFILLGGALTGARVREVNLINELVRRGYRCHVWWAHERDRDAGIHDSVAQRWLFHHLRFAGVAQRFLGERWGRPVDDWLGRVISRLGGERLRRCVRRWRPKIITWGLVALIREICRGVPQDRRLIQRLAREMDRSVATHVLPMLEVLAPFVRAACQQMPRPALWAVTFQGYEVYGYAARQAGLEKSFLDVLRHTTDASPLPPITVSRWYAARVERETGILADRFAVIPPGIPLPHRMTEGRAQHVVREALGITDFATPIVSLVGRQDSEKGIDLLLYAARHLIDRGVNLQLAIVGANAFGLSYQQTCRQIADHLGLDVIWENQVSDEVRNALMQVSACLVCPSIHGEPFGIVAIEAMALGTPVVIPDVGGIRETVEHDDQSAGLIFACHDSGDLCDQIRRLLREPGLRSELAANAQALVPLYSSSVLAERTLLALAVIPVAVESAIPKRG